MEGKHPMMSLACVLEGQRRLVTIITCAIVTVQPLQPAESAKRVHYIWRTRPKLAFRKNRDQPPLLEGYSSYTKVILIFRSILPEASTKV